jgi:hypothetical protein
MKVHNPNNLPTIPIADLLPSQGDLKDLSEKNYNKLKNVILNRGFSYPVYVWEDKDGLLHLLDGHQRQRVLTTEGWNDPIPYLKVPAKDLQEAMARLLEITSQYATITQEGIDTFIATYELPEAEIYEATHYDALAFYSNEENEPDAEDKELYNDNIESPIYEPNDNIPEISDLVDTTKTRELEKYIESLEIPVELKQFLLSASQRFNIFHYGKIADFYPHQSKEVQIAMEKLALIIIDYDKAIENGFIEVDKQSSEQYLDDND